MSDITRIKTETDIVSYAGKFTTLHSTGAGQFRGPCPIHKGTKTENFLVDSTTGYWKCFSDDCGGGSIIDLCIKMEQATDINTAINTLAKEHNITLTEKITAKPVTDDERYKAMRVLTELCENTLDANTPEAEQTLDYLTQRGINDTGLNDYRIGLVPNSETVIKTFAANNIRPAVTEDLGLIRTTFRGKISPIANRLYLPLIDTKQRPVGFSSRALEFLPSAQPDRRYVNSTTNSIYHKNQLSYGEHLTDNTKHLIIVEGNIDAIILHQATKNTHTSVIAASGSAFSESMLTHLKLPPTTPITLYFDNDTAGDKAYQKTLWLLNTTHPVNTPTITPETYHANRGTDPADTITSLSTIRQRKHINELLNSKSTPLDYLLTALTETYEDKNTLAKELSKITNHITNPTIRRDYITTIAKAAEINADELKQLTGTYTPPTAIKRAETTSAATGSLIKELLTIPTPEVRDHIIHTITNPKIYPEIQTTLGITLADNTLISSLFGTDLPTKPGTNISDSDTADFLTKYVWNDTEVHSANIKKLSGNLLHNHDTTTTVRNNSDTLARIAHGPEIPKLTPNNLEYLWTIITDHYRNILT